MCRCIWFAIMLFYRSEIYCPILTLSSTIPSVLHSLGWSIIGLQCSSLLICICIDAIIALISVDIAGSMGKPLEFSRGPELQAGGGDGIAFVSFVTFITMIPGAPWHPKMQFVIRASVDYWHVWVSASGLCLFKGHIGGQIVKENIIVNPRCFHADDHSRHWVLCLLDLTLDCRKSVFLHHLFVALQ